MSKYIEIVALLLCMSATTLASKHGGGAVSTWSANALGKNEIPPVNSDVRSFFKFTESRGKLNGQIIILGIRDFTQAHLHIGNKATNGPIAFWVWTLDSKAISKQPLTGSFIFNWSVTEKDFIKSPAAPSYSAFLKQLSAGNVYYNVHSAKNPGGEIRGQVEKYVEAKEPKWAKSG